jgi:hypothetical protein
VTITTLIHSVDEVSISCQTGSYTVFRNFVQAMEQSGRFTTPVTPPEGYPYIKGGVIKLTPAETPVSQ